MRSVVKSNVGELDNITRGVRRRRMRRDVVGCVQAVAGKKKFLVKFEDEQNKDISDYLLLFLSSKEEVDMDKPLYHYTENNKVNC